MRRLSFPSLIGIFFLVAAIVAGVLLVQYRQVFKLNAASSSAPKNVRITNSTSSSFTVSWTTDSRTQGFIKYGGTVQRTALDTIQGPSRLHLVEVTNLDPETAYEFTISSGGVDFDNNGVLWQGRTASNITPASPNIISGRVLSETGAGAKDALVYISVSGTTLVTKTSTEGVWLANLSLLRNTRLTGFTTIDEASSLIDISVQGPSLEVATAKVFPFQAKPTPNITLGRVHDFRNLEAGQETHELPSADLQLPEASTSEASP